MSTSGGSGSGGSYGYQSPYSSGGYGGGYGSQFPGGGGQYGGQGGVGTTPDINQNAYPQAGGVDPSPMGAAVPGNGRPPFQSPGYVPPFGGRVPMPGTWGGMSGPPDTATASYSHYQMPGNGLPQFGGRGIFGPMSGGRGGANTMPITTPDNQGGAAGLPQLQGSDGSMGGGGNFMPGNQPLGPQGGVDSSGGAMGLPQGQVPPQTLGPNGQPLNNYWRSVLGNGGTLPPNY